MTMPSSAPVAGPAPRVGVSSIRLLTRSERRLRLLYCVLFFYAMLNASQYNVLNGAFETLRFLWAHNDVFWSQIGIGVLVIAMGVIGVMAARRWRLAITQTDLWLLGFQTALVVGVLVIFAAIGNHWFGPWDWQSLARYIGWTWQIPAGFFVGQGLNWSIVDRNIAGLQAVDPRSTGDHHAAVDGHVQYDVNTDPTQSSLHHPHS